MTTATANPLQFLNPWHRPAGALDLGPLTKGLLAQALLRVQEVR